MSPSLISLYVGANKQSRNKHLEWWMTDLVPYPGLTGAGKLETCLYKVLLMQPFREDFHSASYPHPYPISFQYPSHFLTFPCVSNTRPQIIHNAFLIDFGLLVWPFLRFSRYRRSILLSREPTRQRIPKHWSWQFTTTRYREAGTRQSSECSSASS